MVLPGYWMDIGQPHDYLTGQTLHLSQLRKDAPADLASGDHIKGNVMVHPTATIDPSAIVGPNVVVGANCTIGAGVKIQNSTMLAGSTINAHTYFDGSILGWKSTIGSWVRVTGLTVIAEDV
jgi:mannose-1-phosphate guanylyltransferase